MRVLFLCMRMVFEVNDRNQKHTTGYSYMVRDIAEHIGKEGVSVDVLAITDQSRIGSYQNIRILPRDWKTMIRHFRWFYCFKALAVIQKYKPSFYIALHVLYYYLYNGYVEKCIKDGNYDLIHIHGLDFGGLAYADCCERLGVKYLLTLHALSSFDPELKRPKGHKRMERDFLLRVRNKRIPLSTISNGMMGRIKQFLDLDNSYSNFYVVQNGTDVSCHSLPQTDIRLLHKIRNDQNIILCVGNISQGKNQMQILRAVGLVPEETRKNLCVLFLGRNLMDIDLYEISHKLGINDSVRICGNIPRDDIGDYYGQADYTVLASISEGFGLSVIEGFSNGLPCLCFKDLDAISDLYDPNAMVLAESRTDQALADGIAALLGKEWNRELILKHAQKFSMQNTAVKYISIYKNILE